MKTLHYFTAANALVEPANKAAARWNTALKGVCMLDEWTGPNLAAIIVQFGTVNRTRDPQRVAQHAFNHGTGKHIITLASDVKWRVTFWQRLLGIGDHDALSALLHEFGHALGLPHSDRFSDVMHPAIGSTVISDDEAARYRAFLQL